MPRMDTLVAALEQDPHARALWRAGVRPRVGVSACLVGERVRYDGDHRRVATVADGLAMLVELQPLCPEVAIGLGVPRPTIQRVRLADGREIVRGIVDRRLDVTAALDGYAAEVARAPLQGYVFKARSPSCAPGNAPLLDEDDVQLGTAWGRYAEGLRAAWPGVPMADEESIAEPGALIAFVLACYRRLPPS